MFLVRGGDGSRLALVRCQCLRLSREPCFISRMYAYSIQKELLLQVVEQRDSVEKEISMHRAVLHRNVLRLVDAQVTWTEEGEGRAFLLFPFHQVPCSSLSCSITGFVCSTVSRSMALSWKRLKPL